MGYIDFFNLKITYQRVMPLMTNGGTSVSIFISDSLYYIGATGH